MNFNNKDSEKLELSNFKDIHLNEDIYVIGSGKSCDYIDESFFNDKITIGINQVYKKFNCKYLVRKEFHLIDEVLKNMKDSLLFISRGNAGNLGNKNKDYIESKKIYNNKVIIFDHDQNCGCVSNPDNIKKINHTNFDKSKNKLITTSSTILSGVHLAYYMGAKNIILVGHDCCKINGESNFENYNSITDIKKVWKNKEQYDNWISKIESQTIHIKNLLKNNFNVNLYSLNPFVSYNLERNIKN